MVGADVRYSKTYDVMYDVMVWSFRLKVGRPPDGAVTLSAEDNEVGVANGQWGGCG